MGHKTVMIKRCFKGQSTIEFTFTMVMTVLLVVGMIKVFLWTGRDMFQRRQAHEAVLTQSIGYDSEEALIQINPTFFGVANMEDAAVPSNIFGD
jgi:hypothetical protein